MSKYFWNIILRIWHQPLNVVNIAQVKLGSTEVLFEICAQCTKVSHIPSERNLNTQTEKAMVLSCVEAQTTYNHVCAKTHFYTKVIHTQQ